MKIFIRTLISLLVLCVGTTGSAKDIGVVGTTYPVTEKDALVEIEESAGKVNWESYFSSEEIQKKISYFKPEDIILLPVAKEDRSFSVDMSYTLMFDIPDGKGGILYPKGYTFNPLDYVVFPKTLVVLNGEDKDQVNWFKSSQYYKDAGVTLLLTDGSYYKLSQELRRPVFYANIIILERLRLHAVPSIIKQEGRFMEVREIDIQRNDKKGSS